VLHVNTPVVDVALQCFRLYTRSYFEKQMPDTTPPEICRTSLASAVLGLKALKLPGLDVLSFDFLDPPAQVSCSERQHCWSNSSLISSAQLPPWAGQG